MKPVTYLTIDFCVYFVANLNSPLTWYVHWIVCFALKLTHEEIVIGELWKWPRFVQIGDCWDWDEKDVRKPLPFDSHWDSLISTVYNHDHL